MIELDFVKFLLVALFSSIAIIALDILWIIIRLTWSWIDECDLKFKSIGKLFFMKCFRITEIETDSTGPIPWIALMFLTFGCVLFSWVLLSFYYISLFILTLILMAHVARWIRRLTKKFNLHETDKNAHKEGK